MFGLTRREQRWKAEQQAAETMAKMVTNLGRAVAEIRIAEAASNASELERLRAENAELRAQQALGLSGSSEKPPEPNDKEEFNA